MFFYLFTAALWIVTGYEIGNALVINIVKKHGSITAFSKEKHPDKTRRNIDKFGEEKFERLIRYTIKGFMIIGWPFLILKTVWDVLT